MDRELDAAAAALTELRTRRWQALCAPLEPDDAPGFFLYDAHTGLAEPGRYCLADLLGIFADEYDERVRAQREED